MTAARRLWSAALMLNLVVFIGVANWLIAGVERRLENGQLVFLEITRDGAPWLAQGDYMTLQYPICREIDAQLDPNARGSGVAVIRVDEARVGHFLRLHDPAVALADDELLLWYRIRWGRVDHARVAAEEFFFEAEHAAAFRRASYAELRVGDDGRTLLVALCDRQRHRIE